MSPLYSLAASIAFLTFWICVFVTHFHKKQIQKPEDVWKRQIIREELSAEQKQTLRYEYGKAQDMLRHYDRLNWQIGSILVGSNIVALGLITRAEVRPVFVFGLALAGIVSNFMWLWWFDRHRAIYNIKSDRLMAIESMLEMKQHQMVLEADRSHWLGMLSGHQIATMLAIGLSSIWLFIALLLYASLL